MYIKTTYEPEFNELIEGLRKKYPAELFDLEGIGKQLDMSEFSKRFFSSSVTADASVDANANVDDISVIAYTKELPKPLFKINSYYVLWDELRKSFGIQIANEVVERGISGDIYIHDLWGIGAGLPYCFNYSTYDIMAKGLPMVKKVKSLPPKYLYSFKSQVEQFVIIASNSTLGATGLADLLVVMSYYVKNILETKSDAHFKFASEEDCWTYVRENLVSMIYTINQPMRSNQSPFTNVSIYDKYFLEQMKEDYIFPDGSVLDIEIVQKLQEVFLDIMNEEMERTPLTFPVTTACISVDDDLNILDRDFVTFIANKNKEYGFINIYIGKSSTLSSCCRLRSDISHEYFNSFGSGSGKIGSLGVVSINFPRLAFKHHDNRNNFYSELDWLMSLSGMINEAKRRIIKKRIDNGNLPLYSLGFMELEKQYSTTGVNGLNECLEILGMDILEKEGQDFLLDVIQTMNKKNKELDAKYKSPHNLEQVPAENMSIKAASKDRLLGYNAEYEIYSNQFIPLTTNADLLDRIYLQGVFDKHFSGGAICHLNVEDKIEDPKQIEDLIYASAKAGVIYFAINYNLLECTSGHMTVGKGDRCSVCGEEIINSYTRVVGFLTNTKNWHKVRREMDYPNRQFYKSIARGVQ